MHTPFDTSLRKIASFLLVALPVLMLAGKVATDITASLIAVLFLLHVAITRKMDWLDAWWVRVLLVFWVYVMASAPLAAHPLEALTYGFVWGRFFFFGIAIATWLLPEDETLSQKLLITIGIFVFCLASDALIQHYMGTDILGKEKFQQSYRLTGPYRRPVVGAYLIWIMLPTLLGLWQHKVIQQHKWLRFGTLPLLWALGYLAVALSGERGPFLLSGMSVLLIALFLPSLRKALLIGSLLAALLGGAILIKDPVFYQRQILSSEKVISDLGDTPYGKIWMDAFTIGKANWLTGVGARHYRVACNSAEWAPKLRIPCELHPHNMYLELFAETGVIGLALMLSVLALIFWGFWHSRSAWKKDNITAGIFITFLLRIWPIIATTGYFNSISAIPFWLMVGWGMGRVRELRDS